MAATDQNITELPIKTASQISDEDYMLGIDLVEGYQVSTKDFADYAVNRAPISIGGKTQTTASALSEVRTTASNAQPKVSGKGLSTNDFTNAYKTKLDGIATGAEVNVNADWTASSGDAQILHKPTTLTGYGIKSEVDALIDEKGLVDIEEGIDSVPYHFRQTPYGDRLKEKIVGVTVAFNQLLQNGDFSLGITNWGFHGGTEGASVADGLCVFNATMSKGIYSNAIIPMTTNHKYLGLWYMKADEPTLIRTIFNNHNSESGRDYTLTTNYSVYGLIINALEDGNGRAQLRGVYGSTGAKVYFDSVAVFDLTQMFGPAIADHIYTLEQTTAGLGVALFRKLFPKQYYPHNPGELLSVSGLVSHDEIGFNQWDEETITGYYQGSNGQYASASNQLCTKNYIPVLPDTQYCFGKSYNLGDVLFYDENKNFIRADISRPAYYVFTTPTNCHFINLNLGSTYGATYKNDICINLSDPEKNGQYEPYKKHSYPLDSSLTLRGVPKLVDNKIKFDGDVYESDGEVTRRYGIVDLGTLSWNYDSSGSTFSAVISGLAKNAYTSPNLVCSKYPTTPLPTSQFTYGIRYNGGSSSVMVKDSVYTDAATFKTAMSGVMLVYELATPTEESAQPYANPQRCAEGGTEEYVTTGIVPVGHESEYVSNKAERFDALPDSAQEDGDYVIRQTDGIMELVSLNDLLTILAPLENGTTASKAYTTGEYFMHNSQFCKAKTAIASGATFTLNTNYEVTTVGAELYTALHS